MGGMKKIGKNSPQSNFHMGGHYVPPPTLICNSDVPPSWGLIYSVFNLQYIIINIFFSLAI